MEGGTVSVDIPRELLPTAWLGRADLAIEIRKLLAVELVRRGELAFTKAAEILAIPQGEFIECLAEHHVSIFDHERDEIRNELGAGH